VKNGNPGSNAGSGPDFDDQIRAHHEYALSRGEKRVLFRTVDGSLHSYAKDELGVVTASSHPQVRSAVGFLVMAVVFAAVAVFSILLVAGPTSRGQAPMWSALFLTAAGLCHPDGAGSFESQTPEGGTGNPRTHRPPVRLVGGTLASSAVVCCG
jgi:hypothetical protein